MRPCAPNMSDDSCSNTVDRSSKPFPMTIVLDIKLALSERVPELNRAVSRTRHNLSVISTEADAQHIRSMANKAARCEASVEVPEAQCMVPRRGKSELAVGGDNNVGHEVVMSV